MSLEPSTSVAPRAQLVAWLSAQVQIHRARGGPTEWSFCCAEDLVLTLGYWGIPAALPAGHIRGPEGVCYSNASGYGETHNLTYAEGYGLSDSGLVFAHAWCVDQHGYVHDPTWPDGGGLAYLGIPFSASFVPAYEARLGGACLLHDPHLDEYRILREGLPTSAILPIGNPVTAAA